MRDEETGSWWQQVTGEAIQGPLKGTKLKPVPHDELSFGIWKSEQPDGRILKPEPGIASRYEPEDWEQEYAKLPVVVPVNTADRLPPRELVIGIKIDNVAKAYPQADLEKQSPIMDELGGVPIIIVLGEDKKSIRAFERKIDGRVLEIFAKPNAKPLQLIDAETGSVWDFTGKAINGQLAGKQLKQVIVLKDYWFDWKIYNPKTAVYTLGERQAVNRQSG